MSLCRLGCLKQYIFKCLTVLINIYKHLADDSEILTNHLLRVIISKRCIFSKYYVNNICVAYTLLMVIAHKFNHTGSGTLLLFCTQRTAVKHFLCSCQWGSNSSNLPHLSTSEINTVPLSLPVTYEPLPWMLTTIQAPRSRFVVVFFSFDICMWVYIPSIPGRMS